MDWEDFGFSGMVVGALFGLLLAVVRVISRLSEDHRDERKEWRDDAAERQGRTDSVIRDLANAIRRHHDD